MAEQRHHHALEAEAEARGVGHLSVRLRDAEHAAEVILVVVERAHRGALLGRDHRHEHLELQLLRLLSVGEDPPGAAEERIGEHPFVPFNYECLRGGPPGVIVAEGTVYIFMAQGQNPGAMGCFKRAIDTTEAPFVACENNPLFVGAATYGPLDETGAPANSHFDFRTISSAEVQAIGASERLRYYMLYEGVRGPAAGDPGDTQFGLGLARSLTDRVDGPWEKYPGNPLLVDLPGNIGLGHADLAVLDGRTYLYTSLDGVTRSRLVLVWE